MVQRTQHGSHQGSGDLLLGISCREVVSSISVINDSSESSWSRVAVVGQCC